MACRFRVIIVHRLLQSIGITTSLGVNDHHMVLLCGGYAFDLGGFGNPADTVLWLPTPQSKAAAYFPNIGSRSSLARFFSSPGHSSQDKMSPEDRKKVQITKLCHKSKK